jgi:peptidoglycan/LPS O-acetylase OafA/YrhL
VQITSVISSALMWWAAFWALQQFDVAVSTAALLALLPGLSLQLRWRDKGMRALILPIALFVLGALAVIGAQTYAFQFTTMPFPLVDFLLYPCLAMTVCASLLGVRRVIKLRQSQAA